VGLVRQYQIFAPSKSSFCRTDVALANYVYLRTYSAHGNADLDPFHETYPTSSLTTRKPQKNVPMSILSPAETGERSDVDHGIDTSRAEQNTPTPARRSFTHQQFTTSAPPPVGYMLREDFQGLVFPSPGTRAARFTDWMDERGATAAEAAKQILSSPRKEILIGGSRPRTERSLSYQPPEGTRARAAYLKSKNREEYY
jgi:hypothetical protein